MGTMKRLLPVPSYASLRFLGNILRVHRSRPLRAERFYPFRQNRRSFHISAPWLALRTHTLSDVGEGTKEVQIIQWFVEEGARVEEWAKLCEVQSDKAAVDITSRYAGLIKKLHFKKDDIVQVGDVMVDFEVDGVEDEEVPSTDGEVMEGEKADASNQEQAAEQNVPETPDDILKSNFHKRSENTEKEQENRAANASLAAPAVRGMLKEHHIEIQDVEGSGKDGRVLKEDVYKYLEGRNTQSAGQDPPVTRPAVDSKQTETLQKLTPVQASMFKTMTASLSIPHFLYSDTVNITRLSALRTRINVGGGAKATPKLSYLPFVIKAVSLALDKYPILNARLDTTSDPKRPQLVMRSNHNIGVAMDTPSGLLVPVIKNINSLSILSIAQEMKRLSQLGHANRLSNSDLGGATITVSNIGSIGGDVVAPVIVEGQVAILGMGKIKAVPIWAEDGKSLERAEVVGMSWSADHRVVDGATMARMAKVVQDYLEEPGRMIVDLS